MNARCQRALARRYRRDAFVQEGPREEEILEKRDDVPLRIRILCARARGGPPAAAAAAAAAAAGAMSAPINPGMWLNMVDVKLPHLAGLEVDSMKNLSLTISGIVRNDDYCCVKCNNFSGGAA